jgi:hypothetical protein
MHDNQAMPPRMAQHHTNWQGNHLHCASCALCPSYAAKLRIVQPIMLSARKFKKGQKA